MFVTLDGRRVAFNLGRWNSAKAVTAHMDSAEDSALVDLVATSGINETAQALGLEPDQLCERLDQARESVAAARSIATNDLPIIDLIDDLGYSDERVAEVLEIPLRDVRRRYWAARKRLAGRRHDDVLVEAIPELSRRDFLAFELVHVLHYSIGRAATLLGLNRGHLCRRLAIVAELLRANCQAGDHNPPTQKT